MPNPILNAMYSFLQKYAMRMTRKRLTKKEGRLLGSLQLDGIRDSLVAVQVEHQTETHGIGKRIPVYAGT